jgi:hypothetical protein
MVLKKLGLNQRLLTIEEKRNEGDYSDDLKTVFPLPNDIESGPPLSTTDKKISETVQNVFDAYWKESSPNWKPRSETQYRTCHNRLLEFLGRDRMIHSIDYQTGRD